MPNWCENTLSIKGTKEQIVDFNKRYLPNGIFSFENIIPSPQTIEECPEDYILHNEEEETLIVSVELYQRQQNVKICVAQTA